MTRFLMYGLVAYGLLAVLFVIEMVSVGKYLIETRTTR